MKKIFNQAKWQWLIFVVGTAFFGFVFGRQSCLIAYKNGQVSEMELAVVPAKILSFWPSIDHIESNSQYREAIIPSDPDYIKQWYLKRIKANSAWEKSSDATEVVIAVIDSGIQGNHPDLKDNLWFNRREIPGNGIDDDKNGYVDDYYGWDFVNNDNDASPKFRGYYTEDGIVHGTLVAGIAAATGNNTIGISGVAWHAKLMSLKAIDDAGNTDAVKVVKAIDYATKNGANIINLSFIGKQYNKSVEDAIRRAYKAGIIVVAAGGNELSDGHGQNLDSKPMYPVCNDGAKGENMVIGVAATGPLDEKTSFSGYGSKCIDIAAPGMSIYGLSVYSPKNYFENKPFDKYYDGYWSGTSLAVPMVSGALVLIQQANPTLRPKEIVDVLLSSADNIMAQNPDYTNKLGAGRLNVDSAVNLAITRRIFNHNYLALANYDKPGTVKILAISGKLSVEFKAADYQTELSSGDVNGDGSYELIAVPSEGANAKPEVRIFNAQGKLLKSFLAFPDNQRQGLSAAEGDFNNDGKAEIAVALRSGKPEVKIFDLNGKLLKTFLAFDANFKGGVNLAAGDADGIGQSEIVAVPASQANANVRVFNMSGKLLTQFMAFDKSYKGGFKVAVANVYSSIKREPIITVTVGKGLGSAIKIFDSRGKLLRKFDAYNMNFVGGVNLAVADIDNNGEAEVVCGPDFGLPNLTVYKTNGTLVKSIFAGLGEAKTGVDVAVLYIK